MFDPKTDKFPYPEQTDCHYLNVKKNNGLVFDKDYPYIDESALFRFKRFMTRIMLRVIVFPLMKIRLGLRLEGRENIKNYKDVINKGIVSCCNHVHMWDYIAVMYAIRPFKPYLLAWAPNIRGENGKMIRAVGGIPIPDNSIHGTRAYMEAVSGMLKKGGWLHIYPEGSMWEYYRPIRPFKKGAAYFACKNGVPVIPMAFTYREPGALRKKLFGQIALFTLHIGEPLYPDETLREKERETDLLRRAHEAVCSLAGFKPGENIYPPLFDKSRRIDYYTDTYGVGYKHSF